MDRAGPIRCHYRYQACDLGNPDYIGDPIIHPFYSQTWSLGHWIHWSTAKLDV